MSIKCIRGVMVIGVENDYDVSIVGWLVGFYGISTFVGYLIPNPFLYK